MEVCQKCNGTGRVLDFQLGKYVPCPECKKRRQKEVDSGRAIFEKFDLESRDLTQEFIYSKAVKYANTDYTKQSTERQSKYIGTLIANLEKRIKPEESVCFGLGKYGRPDVLAYSIASTAYIQGATVAPVMTCRKLYDLSCHEKQEVVKYIESEILIIIIPVNPTRASLRHAVGIMQERAMSDKSTIFITTYEQDKCRELLTDKKDYSTKWLARPVFVKKKDDEKSEIEEVYKDNVGLVEE